MSTIPPDVPHTLPSREHGTYHVRAFKYMNGLVGTAATATQYNPFNVWKEREPNGGRMNFLTGAGGQWRTHLIVVI